MAWVAGPQNQTEVRVPAVVAQQLRLKPNDKKVNITIEVGSGEHLGLVRMYRSSDGIDQESSRVVNATPTGTFVIRMAGIKPRDTTKAMGATAVSYMVENRAVTLLLPPSHYDTAPDALGYITGEHATESAAEPQEEPRSPAALNVPADL